MKNDWRNNCAVLYAFARLIGKMFLHPLFSIYISVTAFFTGTADVCTFPVTPLAFVIFIAYRYTVIPAVFALTGNYRILHFHTL